MAKIEKFEDIIAWQKAMDLCDIVYSVTNKEFFSKDFGLKDQIRRAAVSVISNIAKGSAGELRAQVYVARNKKYITQQEFELLNGKVLEVSKTIGGFVSYLKLQKSKPQLSKLS